MENSTASPEDEASGNGRETNSSSGRSPGNRSDGDQGKRDMIKFFMGGSAVLIVLIGIVAILKYGIPFLTEGKTNAANDSPTTWSDVKKEVESSLDRANTLYQEADRKKNPDLFAKAIEHYTKGRDRLKKYEDNVNEGASQGTFSVKNKQIWRNLTTMRERAKDKLSELREKSSSGGGGPGITVGNGDTNQDGLTVPDLPDMKQDDRKKLTKAIDHIHTVNDLLRTLKGSDDVSDAEEKLDRAESLRKKAEEIVFALDDKYEDNAEVSAFLQDVKFNHLMALKQKLGGVTGTKE